MSLDYFPPFYHQLLIICWLPATDTITLWRKLFPEPYSTLLTLSCNFALHDYLISIPAHARINTKFSAHG